MWDLDTIKIPSGGGTTWEIADLEGEVVPTRELTGIIIGDMPSRRYYASSFEDSPGSKPTCKSNDMIMGEGDPGGECATCPLNQWGSGSTEKRETSAKACSERVSLLFLRPNEYIPIVIDAPSGSLKALRQYRLRLSQHGFVSPSVMTKVSLKKEVNNDGIAYSSLQFGMVSRLDEGEITLLESYTEIAAGLLTA